MAPCVKQILAQVSEPRSREACIEEYHWFRQWLRALLKTPFVREFFMFEACRLRKCSDEGRRPLAADKCSDEGRRPLAADNLHSDGRGQPSAEADNENRPSFWASRRDIAAATDDNFLPSIGSIVRSKMHGMCKVEAVQRQVPSTKVLRYVMTTPYLEISCSKYIVWCVRICDALCWHCFGQFGRRCRQRVGGRRTECDRQTERC